MRKQKKVLTGNVDLDARIISLMQSLERSGKWERLGTALQQAANARSVEPLERELDNWPAREAAQAKEYLACLAWDHVTPEEKIEIAIAIANQREDEILARLGPHAQRGLKVLKGAHKGYKKAHGEKIQNREQYQQAMDELKMRNPNLSLSRRRQIVAERFNVHPRTIQRYTTP